MDIRHIDERIQRLTRETTGMRGSVLREVQPERYGQKRRELAQATRAYYLYYFNSPNVALP